MRSSKILIEACSWQKDEGAPEGGRRGEEEGGEDRGEREDEEGENCYHSKKLKVNIVISSKI